MKKSITLLVVLLLLVSLTACDGPGVIFRNFTADYTASVNYANSDEYSFLWTENENSEISMTVNIISMIAQDDLDAMSIIGSIVTHNIYTYDILNYTVDAEGTYTAEGKLSSIGYKVKGDNAEKYQDYIISTLKNSKDIDVYNKLIAGDLLITRDDIGQYTGNYDYKIYVVFNIEEGKMNVTNYTLSYRDEDKDDIKNVYNIQDNVVRRFETYKNDALTFNKEYNAMGNELNG